VLQQSLDELTDASRSPELFAGPPAGAARARLQMQMRAVAPGSRSRSFASSLLALDLPRSVQAAGLVVLFAAGTFLFTTNTPITRDDTRDVPRVFLLPMSQVTPGATRHVRVNELCGEETARPVPISPWLHERVFRSYGADTRRATEYELDYLITPELGGATDARNLWPQAYSHTPWNAFVKDELERFLHRQVCDGALDLPTAQQQMASDWIAAYKRHFKTDKPLRDYDAQPLTAMDRDMLLAELQEMGVAERTVEADGTRLLALLHAAREERMLPNGFTYDLPFQNVVITRASLVLDKSRGTR
jgi:hypothetical protein